MTTERPVGYEMLARHYGIDALPHFRSTYITTRSQSRVFIENGREAHVLTSQYDPGPTLGGQLEFALKYEGLHFSILAGLFERVSEEEILEVVREKPTGKYRRRLWYLYEMLTGKQLPIPDTRVGNYELLVDPEVYVVSAVPKRSPRHRILVNLFGGPSFLPLVRNTETLRSFQARRLDRQAQEALKTYPAELLARAVSYLYTKETKSSFQIEHEEPDAKRAMRFVGLLQSADRRSFLKKDALIELQNAIVDSRFANADYRTTQNYVGAAQAFGREEIHYVSPKPADVQSLMDGMLAACEQMIAADVDPVVIAAVLSFGFVYIHPFDDGNGRIHRFLIHHILARTGYAPNGMIFPVSASMLQRMREYDETLESISRPLLPLIDWVLDDNGEMTVRGDTVRHYRYLDLTRACERLYEFVADTVDRQLPEELAFLVRYDAARRAARSVVDMPDRLLDLFVKSCAQNRGSLSKAKRNSQFSMLSDDEVRKMEKAIAEALEGFD